MKVFITAKHIRECLEIQCVNIQRFFILNDYVTDELELSCVYIETENEE